MIDTSILIVSKNRKDELKKTLAILRGLLDEDKHEVCVFLRKQLNLIVNIWSPL